MLLVNGHLVVDRTFRTLELKPDAYLSLNYPPRPGQVLVPVPRPSTSGPL